MNKLSSIVCSTVCLFGATSLAEAAEMEVSSLSTPELPATYSENLMEMDNVLGELSRQQSLHSSLSMPDITMEPTSLSDYSMLIHENAPQVEPSHSLTPMNDDMPSTFAPSSLEHHEHTSQSRRFSDFTSATSGFTANSLDFVDNANFMDNNGDVASSERAFTVANSNVIDDDYAFENDDLLKGILSSQLPLFAANGGNNFSQNGRASWYGGKFHGRKTASGERFNMNAMTAAHPSLPFNTYLKVTNETNGKSVVVKVNDRGPFHGNRILDLSYGAAKKIGVVQRGVANVSIQKVSAP